MTNGWQRGKRKRVRRKKGKEKITKKIRNRDICNRVRRKEKKNKKLDNPKGRRRKETFFWGVDSELSDDSDFPSGTVGRINLSGTCHLYAAPQRLRSSYNPHLSLINRGPSYSGQKVKIWDGEKKNASGSMCDTAGLYPRPKVRSSKPHRPKAECGCHKTLQSQRSPLRLSTPTEYNTEKKYALRRKRFK
ncbi:hypothetical protein RUM44_013660 [Polyplax serrata]|uniref:Uncharacterized protein n=1 Tax=Polyplax serrata TaxID=468196 RepID=A0ABR1BER9_POLSC